MTTAQVAAWLGTHRGSLDALEPLLDSSLTDAALARAMVHRRRAIMAQAINEFRAAIGPTFDPYLDGRASQAPVDAARELRAAQALIGIASGPGREPSVPVLFERAMVAEMEGRFAEARTALDQLLELCPGFMTAAFAAASLALAAGKPKRAIRWLAPIEAELAHTREGTGLLATALRALGLGAIASRYECTMLTCRGDHDSRGNDCAPVDVRGEIAIDDGMPPPFRLETQQDGRALWNDRGNYYLLHPSFITLPLSRLLERQRQLADAGKSLTMRRGPVGAVVDLLVKRADPYFALAVLSRWDRIVEPWHRFRHSARRATKRAARKFIYRPYKRLPEPMRASVPMVVRRLVLDRANRVSTQSIEVVSSAPHSSTQLLRLRTGLESIFLDSRRAPADETITPLEMLDPGAQSPAVSERQRAGTGRIFYSPGKTAEEAARDLPPAAARVLEELTAESELDAGQRR